MTITPLTVYFIMQADSFGGALIGLAILFGVAAVILWINGLIEYSDDSEEFSEYIKRTRLKMISGALFCCIAALAVMPSTKTLCTTIVVPAIANSQAVQKDFPELYSLAVKKLKEQLAPAK